MKKFIDKKGLSDCVVINSRRLGQIKQEFLLPLRENEKIEHRLYFEENRERSDGEFQRDFTRILYSSSFRRLQGKMQLFAVQSDQFIRNRLTHSLVESFCLRN